MIAKNIELVRSRCFDEITEENLKHITANLEEVSDERIDTIMAVPMKGKLKTLLLSIFLGLFGVDRFFLRDIRTGVFKAMCAVLPVFFFVFGIIVTMPSLQTAVVESKWLPLVVSPQSLNTFSFLANLFAAVILVLGIIWWICDIFGTYKTAQLLNFNAIVDSMSDPAIDDEETRAYAQALSVYENDLPKHAVYGLEDMCKKHVPTARAEELGNAKIKNKLFTLLFSIFLGGFGADRFYLKDIKMGIIKAVGCTILTLTPILIALMPNMVMFAVLITIAAYAVMIAWRVADVFITYKATKEQNLGIVSDYIASFDYIDKD